MANWIKTFQQLPLDPKVKEASYKKHMEGWGVPCAVTGEMICLNNLKYWNVDKQRPYKDAAAALADYNG